MMNLNRIRGGYKRWHGKSNGPVFSSVTADVACVCGTVG